MGDENQPTKKRAAGRELSRDNPGLDEGEDVPESEMGTFQRASDEVLSTRKIIKPRRKQPSAEPSSASNPFAGIRLVPLTSPPPPVPAAATAVTETQPSEGEKTGDAVQIDETKSEFDVASQVSVEKPTDGSSEEKHTEGDEAVKEGKKDDEKQDEDLKEEKKDDEKQDEDLKEEKKDDEKQDEDLKEEKKDDEKQDEDLKEEKKDDEKQDEVLKEGKKDDEKQAEAVKGDEKGDENSNANGGDAPLSSFQQLSSSQNAFTGLSGTGFSTSSFSFGLIPKDGSPPQSSSLPSFSFGCSNNGSTPPLFGTVGTSVGNKAEGAAFPSMQEVPRETGEENEDTVFNADSALFEFLDGGWKERGKGEVKVNVVKDETRKARLVMRTKGNLRLILNASLYPDMKLTKMDKKGITFACVNTATEGKDGLTTFALKFRDVSVVEEFSCVVSAHKGGIPASTTVKTPENSPKALDD